MSISFYIIKPVTNIKMGIPWVFYEYQGFFQYLRRNIENKPSMDISVHLFLHYSAFDRYLRRNVDSQSSAYEYQGLRPLISLCL